MIYLELLISFFQIGLFSIGGGYAAMPLIENQVVTLHHWLSMAEFVDVVTISQMTPGPISINSATFVGTRVAGLPGAIVATIGCVLPSCFIVLALAALYYKYRKMTLMQEVLHFLHPIVIALIGSAGISLCVVALLNASGVGLDWVSVLLFIGSLIVLRSGKLGPTVIMVSGGILYAIIGIL